MKKTLLSILLLFTLTSLNAQNWEWFIQHVGVGEDIDVADEGTIHLGGFFAQPTIIGPYQLNPTGPFAEAEILTASFDQNGNVLWANSAGGNYEDRTFGVSHDSLGNTYITGQLNISVVFDTLALSTSGSYDIFVAQYDASGAFQWLRQVGGVKDESGNDIVTDAQGNTYVTGYFSDTMYFDNHVIGAPWNGPQQIYHSFLAKYDMNGNAQWARSAGSWHSIANSADIDGNGNVYITGYFNDSITFDSITLYSNGQRDLYIAKYSPTGDALWATSIGGAGWDEGKGISANQNGECFVTGVFADTIQVNGNTLIGAGGTDVLIAKFNAQGNLEWMHRAGGAENDIGYGINYNEITGNIGLVGSFKATANFENNTMTSNGLDDLFIAEYDSNGNLIWVHGTGGSGRDAAHRIDSDAQGAFYVTGAFFGSVQFGTNTYSTGPGVETDFFVVKIAQPSQTSIDEMSLLKSEFNIFPNPTSNELYVTTNIPYPNDLNVSLQNLQGTVLRSFNCNLQDKLKIDIEDIPSGIYLVRINTQGKIPFTSRVLITNN